MEARFPGDFKFQRLAKDLAKQGEENTRKIIQEYFPECEISNSNKSHTAPTDVDLLLSPKSSKFECDDLQEFLSSKSTLTGPLFWEANGKTFKNLNKLYRRFKPVQYTNASIERLFSQANLVFDDLAASTDTEMITSRLLLKKDH